MAKSLLELREQIDAIDDGIFELLQKSDEEKLLENVGHIDSHSKGEL